MPMTLNEFRIAFESFRAAVQKEASGLKDPIHGPNELAKLYRKFDDAEPEMAATVLAQWVLSPDEAARYDARFLISEFRIVAAADALKELALRLKGMPGPGTAYEREATLRLAHELERAAAPCNPRSD